MLTERGWAVAGTGIALVVLWYLFGETELGVAALLALVALAASALMLLGREAKLEVMRRTSPAGVHEGEHASVMLSLVNRGRSLDQVTVADEVEGLGTAEFAAARFPGQDELRAVYRVLCRPRGVYSIGPALVTLRDPLGLASRLAHTGNTDMLVVYPAVEDLTGLPASFGQNPSIESQHPRHGHQGGEDFYTLREYQQGDDLRRIHWRSSARRDRLMIRQLETPWQARSLVMLDIRSSAYPDGGAFEAAVTGTASVARHLVGHAFDAELWAGGSSVDLTPRASGYAVAMERLARVQAEDAVDLAAVASRLRYRGGGGMLVMITGSPDEELLGMSRVLAGEYPSSVLLASQPNDLVAAFQRGGTVTVTPEPGRPWAPAWAGAMRSTWQSASVGS